MKRILIVMVVGMVAAFTAAGEAQAASPATSPNVLFIGIDDLNDWVGCLGGHPDTKTPNIDRLARRGMLFTNAQCAAPACVPSRSALMTGLRPADTGLYSNMNGEYRRFPDLKDLVTIPQYFAQHGYYTMGVGKSRTVARPKPIGTNRRRSSIGRTRCRREFPRTVAATWPSICRTGYRWTLARRT